MNKIVCRLKQFDNWFNFKFGWFFYNGRKAIERAELQQEMDIKTASTCLEKARLYNLDAEVVVYALKCMKVNPSLTAEEAILMAFPEWLK